VCVCKFFSPIFVWQWLLLVFSPCDKACMCGFMVFLMDALKGSDQASSGIHYTPASYVHCIFLFTINILCIFLASPCLCIIKNYMKLDKFNK
jgi:hypothetical protein